MATQGPLFSRLLQDRSTRWFLLTLAALAIVMPLLNLLVPADSPFHVSTYTITLQSSAAAGNLAESGPWTLRL